jgi:melanoma-associated antigen p97
MGSICNYFVGGVSKSDFELLCQDGSRRPVDEYQSCYWDVVPTHAVVTTSAKSVELRKSYQRFLKVSNRLHASSDSG